MRELNWLVAHPLIMCLLGHCVQFIVGLGMPRIILSAEEQVKPDDKDKPKQARVSVQDLIKRLGSVIYGERELASEELKKRLVAAGDLLLDASLSGVDPEIANRATALLKDLKCEEWMEVADVFGAKGDHRREKEALLRAFALADMTQLHRVLFELTFCHRGLRDFRAAARYMELVVRLSPDDPHMLYCQAITLYNDRRVDEAIQLIEKARGLDPNAWHIKMLEGGYLYKSGKRAEGLKILSELSIPEGERETDFYRIMHAWSFAVTDRGEEFFPQFQKALESSRSLRSPTWASQDEDLDKYRDDPRFKKCLEENRERILNLWRKEKEELYYNPPPPLPAGSK